jgi:hypothetical protein
VNNARLAAWVAEESGSAGIWFDPEQSHHRLFDYDKQRDAKTRSFEEYAAQARNRGAEVMNAFQEGYPGLTVFFTLAYSFPWRGSGAGKLELAKTRTRPARRSSTDGRRRARKTRLDRRARAVVPGPRSGAIRQGLSRSPPGVLPIVANRRSTGRCSRARSAVDGLR